MGRLVKHGRQHPEIRRKALELTQSLGQKETRAEIDAVFSFVRDGIRYVRDIHNVETLHYPEIVLEQGSGDCDDKAVLLASLLESIGHPTRFVALAFQPGQFSHVITDTRLGYKRWLPMDPTENVPPGWRPPNIKDTMIWFN